LSQINVLLAENNNGSDKMRERERKRPENSYKFEKGILIHKTFNLLILEG